MEQQVEDIAGIRIICQFVEDIERVAQIINARSDIEIKSEKDYIRHMKDSGYRSYHLIVYYTVETLNGPKKLQVEIQIRTMAMDFWATIEHSLQYKIQGEYPQAYPAEAERRGGCNHRAGQRDVFGAQRNHGCAEFVAAAAKPELRIFSTISKIYISFPTSGRLKRFRMSFTGFTG